MALGVAALGTAARIFDLRSLHRRRRHRGPRTKENFIKSAKWLSLAIYKNIDSPLDYKRFPFHKHRNN